MEQLLCSHKPEDRRYKGKDRGICYAGFHTQNTISPTTSISIFIFDLEEEKDILSNNSD